MPDVDPPLKMIKIFIFIDHKNFSPVPNFIGDLDLSSLWERPAGKERC
jgi:hypothetical protein